MKTNSDDLAYPFLRPFKTSEGSAYHLGLTKRELFAAMALQGICSSETIETDSINQIVGASVLLADALIERLNK